MEGSSDRLIMSSRSQSKEWRQNLNFTAKEKTGQLGSPAEDSGLDPEKLEDSVKQRNTVITVYFRGITGQLHRAGLEGGLDKGGMRPPRRLLRSWGER